MFRNTGVGEGLEVRNACQAGKKTHSFILSTFRLKHIGLQLHFYKMIFCFQYMQVKQWMIIGILERH